MKIVVGKDYNEMSQIAAHIVLGEMLKQGRVNLSLTAGNTPKGMYEILVPAVKDKGYFDNVHYYNFDEIPIEGERYGLTMDSLKQLYYTPAGIKTENIHELNEKNYQGYDRILEADGGLDLILMGIGADGHFCGNMPGTMEFHKETYSMDVTPGNEMYQALYDLLGREPGKNAVTFGPKTVMSAKRLVLVVNGRAKAGIVKQAIKGPVDKNVPSSILQMHPDFTVILDEEAASAIRY